jgi:hypothetical protein
MPRVVMLRVIVLGVVALAGAFDSGKRKQLGLNVIKLFISEIYEFL